MTTPAPVLRSTNDLVCQAWIATIPGFSVEMVAPQLPPDTTADGQPSQWVRNGRGFVSYSLVGGNPDPLLPISRPVFQVDCWAVTPGSGLPPWNTAAWLSETIKRATWDRQTLSRTLNLSVVAHTSEGVETTTYPAAAVNGARVVTEPRRMWEDVGDYARYSLDLWLQWVQLDDVIP